jgi:hypothetical protein
MVRGLFFMEKSAHNISDLPPGMPSGFAGDGSQRLPFGIEDMRAWSPKHDEDSPQVIRSPRPVLLASSLPSSRALFLTPD